MLPYLCDRSACRAMLSRRDGVRKLWSAECVKIYRNLSRLGGVDTTRSISYNPLELFSCLDSLLPAIRGYEVSGMVQLDGSSGEGSTSSIDEQNFEEDSSAPVRVM